MADVYLCPKCTAVWTREPLTPRQYEVLCFVGDWIHTRGTSPSHREIAARFELRSLATVHELLAEIERKGWIVITRGAAYGLRLVEPAPC